MVIYAIPPHTSDRVATRVDASRHRSMHVDTPAHRSMHVDASRHRPI